MEGHRSLMSPEKRLFTQHMMATETNGGGDDTTDNVKHFRTTKYIHTVSTTTTKKIVEDQQQQYKTGSIAQHVERLFGPGALAQGFHTNRRSMENSQATCVLTEKSMNSRNFFSPVVKMTRKEAIANGQEHNGTMNGGGMENLKELEVALPVFRHLRPEFREQLPICASPRRYVPPTRDNHSSQMTNGSRHPSETIHLPTVKTPTNQAMIVVEEKIGDAPSEIEEDKAAKGSEPRRKDGNYFLDVLTKERERILSLADIVDGYMELVKDMDVNEEVIGYLRAASGKARLLAAQKIKQFEGLCHTNLTQTPGEKFQTTDEDLQGFWDMVMLQVNHVDSLFEEIEALKVNNWKKKSVEAPAPPQGSKLTKRPVGVKGGSTAASSGQSKKSGVASLAAQKREAQRKQLMELKKKNRMAMNQGQNGDDTSSSKSNGVEQV